MMWIAIIIIVFGTILLISSIIKIQPHEKGVKERFVKYDSVLEPGYHFLTPLVDSVIKVDMRESNISIGYNDIGLSETYAQYQITISIQAIDPVLALYEKENYINKLKSTLENIFLQFIEKGNIKNIFKNKQNLEEILWEKLRIVSKEWGIKINKIEIIDNTKATKHDTESILNPSIMSLDGK